MVCLRYESIVRISRMQVPASQIECCSAKLKNKNGESMKESNVKSKQR